MSAGRSRPVGEIDRTTRQEIADRVMAEHADWCDALAEYGREVARLKMEAAGIIRQNGGVFEIDADDIAP